LIGPDHRTVQWPDVQPERLPEVLANHQPLCWNCHVAESFRQQHPELVIDNPWKAADGEAGR
jgi:5-methylcytosine-specific restriction endonuclease McrA